MAKVLFNNVKTSVSSPHRIVRWLPCQFYLVQQFSQAGTRIHNYTILNGNVLHADVQTHLSVQIDPSACNHFCFGSRLMPQASSVWRYSYQL